MMLGEKERAAMENAMDDAELLALLGQMIRCQTEPQGSKQGYQMRRQMSIDVKCVFPQGRELDEIRNQL